MFLAHTHAAGVSVSAFLFYTSNLVIVSGYAFAAFLITKRALGATLSIRAWVAGISFFVFCGLSHLEMAYHSYMGESILRSDGSVSWHQLAIHIPQAFAIWLFLLSMRPLLNEPQRGPFMKLRCWWWRLGLPSGGSPVMQTPLEGVAGHALAEEEER